GLSGGTIVVRPLTASRLVSNENTIIGNTVLYGATAGRLFAAGQAGERFCVRNSDAVAVVEGCGSNGCEYMTGGTAVILGPVGDNFAAGMTGGMAFVYDADESLPNRINPDSVIHQRIETAHWEGLVKELIAEHVRETQSRFAERLLVDWRREKGRFWQIVPKEMLERLAEPLRASPRKRA
ncbi:MAG: glutamate synthase large subunit, partial [Geminicoccales bacterium]